MKRNYLFNKRLLFVSIIIYVIFVCVIVQSVYVFRNLYRDAEDAYIEQVQKDIQEALQTKHWKADLDKIVENVALEVIIRDQEGNRLYSTIELADNAKIKGVVNDNAKFLESFEQTRINGEKGSLWYVIYQVPFVKVLQDFIVKFNVLILLIYIALVLIIIWLQRKLLTPLYQISTSLDRAERNELDEQALTEVDDQLNERLNNFFLKQKHTLHSVYGKNTHLEIALALEREHLENTINLSKAMVHDLKGPLHNQLLESEMKLIETKERQQREFFKNEIAIYNQLLLEINDILHQLRENMYEFDAGIEQFDLVDMVRTSQLYQMNELKHKKLSFFFDGPEQAMIWQNKVAVRLLLHNISSNMVHYTLENSELEILLEQVDKDVHLTFKNVTQNHHIQTILESNQSPFLKPKVTKDYSYSSGNGIYLIKDLAKFLHGSCEYLIEENYVVTRLVIPNEEKCDEDK
ncbi:sensor histidine kinase [Candidatus Enterococcus murrayae]|uniref:Sensor histidine kinase n=1 Tax=Candidatus Enterococcus murrayae TaxID=2815321 RepID=A0ABS3HMT1_9ENTE|nr:sensor histidine kinase [Enterococcus sp. MJM16]MBO0454760.1 sensor histidine kinase [Enterococcus sp. MJM16]